MVIIFYDGDCMICSSGMRLLHRLDDGDVLRFAPLAGETAQKMGVPNGESVIVIQDGDFFEKSEAVRVVLNAVIRPLAVFLDLLPLALRDRAYDFIAARRQMFSKVVPACGVPEEGFREKFLK